MLVDSSLGLPGDRVMLLSPPQSFEEAVTMTFRYYMHLDSTDTTAALTVYTYSPLKTFDQQLFTVSGDHGSSWQLATVCLPAGKYQVAFVATIGITYFSDIALDRVTVDLSTDM
jgi:hypothetical protein